MLKVLGVVRAVLSNRYYVMGVDLNPDVIGWAYCDREGNLQDSGQIRVDIQDRTSAQTQASLGDACKELVEIATCYGCPITIEQLNFSQKKINHVANPVGNTAECFQILRILNLTRCC